MSLQDVQDEMYRSEAYLQLREHMTSRYMVDDARKELEHVLTLIQADNRVMELQANLLKKLETHVKQLENSQ